MIIDFSVANFRSFNGQQTLSFYAEIPGTHLVENISYPGDGRVGVLKSAGIYGPNASGKSNLLLALRALDYLVGNSRKWEPGKPIECFEPFALATTGESEPTSFEIEFFARNGIRYFYSVSFNRERVLKEHLDFYPSAKSALIFDRNEEDTWETIRFGTLFTGGRKRIAFFDNSAYLSKAGGEADAPELIRAAYIFLTQEILNLRLNETLHPGAWAEDRELVAKVSRLLAYVDTGIADILVEESDVDLKTVKLPDGMPEELRRSILRDMKRSFRCVHKARGGIRALLDMDEESAGTQKLFYLAPLIADALNDGGVLVVDELDNSMHPFMAELIIKLFNDPDVNCGRAQLLFSTHNTSLMSPELLRRDQIWLTEKTNGATRLFSVDDFDKRKVKPQSPFNRWYLEGRFGGTPQIDYRRIANILSGREKQDA